MPKKVILFLGNGTEELEFIITQDILNAAELDVKVVGVPDKTKKVLSRGIEITPDIGIDEINENDVFDALVMPGGYGGSNAFCNSNKLGQLLKLQEERNQIIAAMCAAPTALRKHKIAIGKTLTSYPAVRDTVVNGDFYKYKEDNIVIDGNLITGRGPGTEYQFAIAVLEQLIGREKTVEIVKSNLTVTSSNYI